MTARRGRPGHDRAAVVAAAVALFTRQGYDGTSIGDLARELGVTKSAVYHHVDSKESLLAEALDSALAGLEEALAEARSEDAERTAYDRLRGVVRRSVEVLVERQPAVTLLLRVHGNSDTEREALRRRRRIDTELAALVANARDEGALRADLEPELVGRLVFGMVNSLVEWYAATGSLDADTLADTVVTLTFEGLDA